MRHITRKLHSQRGATLLLGLLFFLLCTMVAASVLMAAVSNAGKLRSNEEEHQTYLALSSAVRTLCDELSAAEYKGRYTYTKTVSKTTQTDDDGKETDVTTITQSIVQKDGLYTGALQDILLDNFDAIFADAITSSPQASEISYTTKSDLGIWKHELTVRPQTGTTLDAENMQVDIEMHVVKQSYAIELTASLNGFEMEAELTPVSTHPPQLTIPSLPDTVGIQTIERETDPMKWKIGWITISEAGQEGNT